MSVKARVQAELARVPGAMALARLSIETIRVCLRYRVTGLASEAGFFALLSLPPLVLGLFGGVGYVGHWLGPETITEVTNAIQRWAGRFLTEDINQKLLAPTLRDVLGAGRFDLISVGFLLSVWSGSRALNVFVDTISIMYGQSGVRGIVRTRALSLSLYLVSLLVGIVVVPLVLIGPTWLGKILPSQMDVLTGLYWPVVTFLAVASITTLYHVATPRRSPWLRDLPGAVLTLVIWAFSSFVVRGSIAASLGGSSIYGPLSAPIVLLIWLYALAIAILIGAALNAAIRTLWPVEERLSARARAVVWARDRMAGRGEEATPVLGAPVGRKRRVSPPLTPMPEQPHRASDKPGHAASQVGEQEGSASVPGREPEQAGASTTQSHPTADGPVTALGATVAGTVGGTVGGAADGAVDGARGGSVKGSGRGPKRRRRAQFVDGDADRLMSVRTHSAE